MVLEQINTDQDKENISVNELRDAVKPGWFLDNENSDYDENIKSVWDLLNNSEQLSEEDRVLTESLRFTLNAEKEKIKNWNTVTEEDKELLKVRIDLVWEDLEEVHELEELINLHDNEVAEQDNEVNTQNEKIIQKFWELSAQDIKSLKDDLSIWWDLINDIDWVLDKWNIDLTNTKCIKAVNILNNIIKEDPERYEKLKNIVKFQTIEMSHEVNIKIAKNNWQVWDSIKQERVTVWNIDYYSVEQKMLVQLRANICYWENLEIDWCRWNKKEKLWEMLFSFGQKTENQKLTSIYIYRLEIITRQDIMNSRNIGESLFNMPELDEILGILPREDQNKIMEEFLEDCFLRVRMDWMHFEDLIWNEYFKKLLILKVKVKTEWNISIEQWIKDRQHLLESLWNSWNETIIKNIQEEINALSIKSPATWMYVFKTMWEYYQSQVDDLKNTIKLQNKNNVDIEQRQNVKEETTDMLSSYNLLLELNELNQAQEYKSMLLSITDKLASFYNNANTKYREWIEKGELIDLYVVKNLAVKFNKYLSPEEQNSRWQDFANFMNKCRKEVSNDINKCSDTLDILSQIESVEAEWNKYELEPTYWRPWTFASSREMDFYASNIWAGLTPPNMPDPSNPDVLNHPISYKLQIWTSRFEWWLWVKNIYNKIQSWEMNVIITKSGYPWRRVEAATTVNLSTKTVQKYLMTERGLERVPAVYEQWFWWELCKYEEHDWEIWLYKFGPNWELPSEPTKKITSQDIVHSNLAMASAMESIDTEDFNNVINQFKEEEIWSFAEIQKSIESLIGKYNNQDLSHNDMNALRNEIWTMLNYIDNIPVSKLRELRNVLDKMKWNKNRITNPYEQEIEWRINQIDILLKIHDDPHYREYLFKLASLESNDNRYEQVNWEEIVGILWSIAAIVVCIVLAAPSWWSSLCGAAAGATALSTFLTWVAAGAMIKTTTYLVQQEIRTSRNFRQASVKVTIDRNWNTVEIPWYLEEQDMSTFYKYRSWQISFGEHLLNVTKELWPKIVEGVLQSMQWFMIWKLLWQLSKTLKMGYDFYRKGKSYYWILTKFLVIWLTTEVVFRGRTAPNTTEVDIMKDIDNCFDTLIPEKLRSWSRENERELRSIFLDITCKSMDDNWNLTMEYDPDSKYFKSLLRYYTESGGVIRENNDWVIIIEHNNKTIKLFPSKIPASYRQLSVQDKKILENIWWINVNHTTWEITYENPEWLEWLRALWAYLENSWEWEVFINDNQYAKIVFLQSDWGSSVVTVQPSKS